MSRVLSLIGVGSLLGLVVGCRSLGEPASASFASVTIAGHEPAAIRNATVAVFQRDGYQTVAAQSSAMIFEREGSRMNQVVYGKWLDEGVWLRVKAEIVPVGNAYRLQCQAFMVRDHGDKFFEEEQRLLAARSRPFQELLDQVAQQLNPTNQK